MLFGYYIKRRNLADFLGYLIILLSLKKKLRNSKLAAELGWLKAMKNFRNFKNK